MTIASQSRMATLATSRGAGTSSGFAVEEHLAHQHGHDKNLGDLAQGILIIHLLKTGLKHSSEHPLIARSDVFHAH